MWHWGTHGMTFKNFTSLTSFNGSQSQKKQFPLTSLQIRVIWKALLNECMNTSMNKAIISNELMNVSLMNELMNV